MTPHAEITSPAAAAEAAVQTENHSFGSNLIQFFIKRRDLKSTGNRSFDVETVTLLFSMFKFPSNAITRV